MKPNSLLQSILFLTGLVLFFACANRGNPNGGPKDEEPPKIVKATPNNYSTNFSKKVIKIYFNEYIKIKNLQKQLIISPPMKNTPEVTPLGTASKHITIKIYDTLQPNTTYAFNFGNSIVDNNEENPFTYYKYVFSTGNYIDSLSVSGRVKDAVLRKPEDFISVRLYEIDSSFNDSVVYNKLPKYVTNTLDSATTYSIENIKEGKYLLVALKDKNQDNKYQQNTDKIGFYPSFISIPTDSLYTLSLFQEAPDFKVIRPRLMAGQKIVFGFQGDYANTTINTLSPVPNNFRSRITKDPKTDSLLYWYKPKLKDVDSLIFRVVNKNYEEDFTVKIKDQKKDTLAFHALPQGTILLEEDFTITASTPLTKFTKKKFTIQDKDSLEVLYKIKKDTLKNTIAFQFDKTENNRYRITALPGAFTDFFNSINDTLQYNVNTKSLADYGNIRINLQNVTYPIIVQLTDKNGTVKKEQYSTKKEPVDFRLVEPGTYYFRVIFDTNKNKKYDSGNYLKKTQAERVSHYKEKIEVRANWDPIIDFTLLE